MALTNKQQDVMVENGSGFTNRIVGYGVKAADQFLFNPRNPRQHPQHQRDVVNASLRELGFVAPVVENLRSGFLLDGHERVWQALQNNSGVPFVQVDIAEDEEPLFLASFDYMTDLAQFDAEILDSLLRDVQTSDAALQQMLAEMATEAGLNYADVEFKEYDESVADDVEMCTCPQCGHQFPK
jgi:hypothetical protein